MSDPVKSPLAPARDRLESYYTEKIWEWIPAVYKDEDALASRPGVLRSIVTILARQAAIARRSTDRLWEDQFIEQCDDWAIPYIGDLVGTRLVHELNRRGRRVDVARTIFYRRRKGTPRVLEILIRDISGWQGVLVEGFRRLARTRHALDPEPMGLEAFVTSTLPGGWARLTSSRGAELVDGPFDEFARTPDFRRLRGRLGRYNIPKLNFHLLRLAPNEVRFATAASLGDGRFTFDPAGREVPLFRPDQRPAPERWRPPREWELPAPIPCRLLGAESYAITAAVIDELAALGLPPAAADELSRYAGGVFRGEARLRQTLESLAESGSVLTLIDPLLHAALTEDSPKAHLVPTRFQSDPVAVAVAVGEELGGPTVEHQRIAAGDLADWGAGLGTLPAWKALVIDPARGRFWFRTPPTENVWVPVYHYGLTGNIGAGTYDRRDTVAIENVASFPTGGPTDPGPIAVNMPAAPPLGGVFQFDDSKTYLPDADLIGIDKLTIQAANFQRPYVKVLGSSPLQWRFEAAPKDPVPPGESDPEENLRQLTMEGVWIGIEEDGASAVPVPCDPVPATLLLDGVFDRVVIRHCTLDPGGETARMDPGECRPIPYVQLVVRGNIGELVILSSIVGPIIEDDSGSSAGTIQRLIVRDSIVHSIDSGNVPAIGTVLGRVELERVTVFGDVLANRLLASEALIQGLVKVTDNQHGCFRFSATNEGSATRLPPRFESHVFGPSVPNHFFVSRRFGDPGYAQLSDTAPERVTRGAENRSEIGAFSSLLGPIRMDDLRAKIHEFMPFGFIPQFTSET